MYESKSDTDEEGNEDGNFKPSKSTSSSTKKGASSTSKTGGYRIQNVLKVPRATTYTTQSLYEQIHSSDINLEPEYQRGIVWPEAKQIGVIDSIFRNFYIPPVIFAVNQSDDGSETKTCIDGKQRLTSIYRFMDGLICHKDPITSEKLWYKDIGPRGRGKMTKKILPDKYRRLFAGKQIVCIEYQDITSDDEREIFQRVQLGMALTPAEKLQALSGPMASMVRQLTTKYLSEGMLVGDALDWDRSRGGDFRCFAQALWAIEKITTTSNSYSTMPQLEKWLSQDLEPTAAFRKKVFSTYDVLVGLVHDKSLNSVFKDPIRLSPIEFTFISLLVAVHKDTLTPKQLSKAIELMREDARTKHADIRMNSRVSKTFIEFIRQYKITRGATPKAEETAGFLAKLAPKRKRFGTADDDKDVSMKSPTILGQSRHLSVQLDHMDTDTSMPPTPTLPWTSRSIIQSIAPSRLVAIRAAKDKLGSASTKLPLHDIAREGGAAPSSPRPEVTIPTTLRSSLHRGRTRSRSRSRSRSSKIRSRSGSKDGSRTAYRSDRDYDRDRSSGRSSPRERRRTHDGQRNYDSKGHRMRDRGSPNVRRDSEESRGRHDSR